MEKAQDQRLVGKKVRTVHQTVHSGYERLARYGGKEATQRKLIMNCVHLALIDVIFPTKQPA